MYWNIFLQTVACRKGSPQWSFISISLNGKAAALVDKEGYIWAGSSDFKVLVYVDCCNWYNYPGLYSCFYSINK